MANSAIKHNDPTHPAGTSVISSYNSNFFSNFSMCIYENFFIGKNIFWSINK